MQLRHLWQFRCGQGQSLSLSVPQYRFLRDQSVWNSQCNKRFAILYSCSMTQKILVLGCPLLFPSLIPTQYLESKLKKTASKALSVKTSESFQGDKLHPHISVSSCNSFIAAVLTYKFFSCFSPFWRAADTIFNTVSVWLCMITIFYKQKQRFKISSAIILLIVSFLTLRTFFFVVCCHLLPCSCKWRSPGRRCQALNPPQAVVPIRFHIWTYRLFTLRKKKKKQGEGKSFLSCTNVL